MSVVDAEQRVRAIFEDAASDVGHEMADIGTLQDDNNANASDAVLVVEDIAALLRVGRNTVYGLVARNQIPHRRLGKTIRFSRTAVMSWLSSSWQVAKEGK